MTLYQHVVANAFVILSFASSVTGKSSVNKVTFIYLLKFGTHLLLAIVGISVFVDPKLNLICFVFSSFQSKYRYL